MSDQGSSSLSQPDYWWYRARSELLRVALGDHLGSPDLVLDVGSADGPSVGWVRASRGRICLDVDPRGLSAGTGICGSAEAVPLRDESFDAVVAFDVIEHCTDRPLALRELGRVLRPGGRLLISVPAYRWAWSDHDVHAGHHTRYTRPRIVAELRTAGFEIDRASYAFTSTFPLFAAERLARRIRPRRTAEEPRVPQVGPTADRILMALTRLDARMLRRRDLPFGSSVLVAARKPQD
ncbi:MAG TPA: class I SAM-dependent methyltransferase [Marmoricola sp.]